VNLFGRIIALIQINGQMLLDSEMNSVGVGVYLRLSRLDHSCWPSAVISFHGTQAQLRPITDTEYSTITTDDDLHNWHIGYTDVIDVKGRRQQILRKQYFFDCHCIACETNLMEDEKHDTANRESMKCTDEQCDSEVCRLEEMTDAQTLHEHIKSTLLQAYANTNIIVVRSREKCIDMALLSHSYDIVAEHAFALTEVYNILYPRYHPTMVKYAAIAGKASLHNGDELNARKYLSLAITLGTRSLGRTHPMIQHTEALLESGHVGELNLRRTPEEIEFVEEVKE